MDGSENRGTRTARAHALIEGLRLLAADLAHDYGGLAQPERYTESLVGTGVRRPLDPVVHQHGLDLVAHAAHVLPGKLECIFYGEDALIQRELGHRRR